MTTYALWAAAVKITSQIGHLGKKSTSQEDYLET